MKSQNNLWGLRDVKNDPENFIQLKVDILKTLEKTAQEGFDKGLVKCVLNMIEMNGKSQKKNPGIELLESFMGYFNYQNYNGLKEAMNITGKKIIFEFFVISFWKLMNENDKYLTILWLII